MELIKKQQEKKRRRQAKRNQMSRKEFIEWCRAQDRSLKMIWIDEEKEKDEQDSWVEISRRKLASTSKVSERGTLSQSQDLMAMYLSIPRDIIIRNSKPKMVAARLKVHPCKTCHLTIFKQEWKVATLSNAQQKTMAHWLKVLSTILSKIKAARQKVQMNLGMKEAVIVNQTRSTSKST